jgi:hypothetical protein
MSNIWEHENKLSYYRVCYWFRLDSFDSVEAVYVGLDCELSKPNSIFKQSM